MAIYFVRADKSGPVKIGYTSRDVIKRVSQMQTGSPFPMVLVGVIDGGREQERAIQEQFRGLHLRGEWFIVDGALREYLDALPLPTVTYEPKSYLPRKGRDRSFNPGGYERGRRRGLSFEEYAKIKLLLETTTMPKSKIARQMKIPPSNISYHFPDAAKLRPDGVQLGRKTQITKAQFAEIERRLLKTQGTIPQIARRIVVRKKPISPSTINHHFPGWRGKLVKERVAYRKLHPLPESE